MSEKIVLREITYEQMSTLVTELKTNNFVKDKEIERLNNIINEYDKYALAIAKIRDLHYSLLNDKNFRILINEILEELKGSDK